MFGTRNSGIRTKTESLGMNRMESTVDSLFIDENDFEIENTQKPCDICMQYVNKRYSSISRTLGDLRNVNVNIYQGDVFVILGRHPKENETILKLIAGNNQNITSYSNYLFLYF